MNARKAGLLSASKTFMGLSPSGLGHRSLKNVQSAPFYWASCGSGRKAFPKNRGTRRRFEMPWNLLEVITLRRLPAILPVAVFFARDKWRLEITVILGALAATGGRRLMFSGSKRQGVALRRAESFLDEFPGHGTRKTCSPVLTNREEKTLKCGSSPVIGILSSVLRCGRVKSPLTTAAITRSRRRQG